MASLYAPFFKFASDAILVSDRWGRIREVNAQAVRLFGYAAEELVAELGSAFLCADLGVTPEPREDHAAYLATWLEVLKNDKRAIFTAAAHAQRAADFLHGLQPKET